MLHKGPEVKDAGMRYMDLPALASSLDVACLAVWAFSSVNETQIKPMNMRPMLNKI